MERTLSSYPGYRGNIILRAEKIHEPFVSLEQLLHGLPEDVAFDIEISSFSQIRLHPGVSL